MKYLMHFFSNLRNLTETCVFILLLITITSFLGNYWWVFDTLAHVRVQYLLCAVIGSISLVIIRFVTKEYSKRWLWISVLLIVANSYPVINFYHRGENPSQNLKSKDIIRMMSLNVLTQNRRYTDVISEIESEAPDILLLMEVNEEWVQQLSTIESEYQHKIAIPREDNFGIALYSKKQFLETSINNWGKYGLPYITASVKNKTGDTDLLPFSVPEEIRVLHS